MELYCFCPMAGSLCRCGGTASWFSLKGRGCASSPVFQCFKYFFLIENQILKWCVRLSGS